MPEEDTLFVQPGHICEFRFIFLYSIMNVL